MFKCDQCLTEFSLFNELKKHKELEHNSSQFYCSYCNREELLSCFRKESLIVKFHKSDLCLIIWFKYFYSIFSFVLKTISVPFSLSLSLCLLHGTNILLSVSLLYLSLSLSFSLLVLIASASTSGPMLCKGFYDHHMAEMAARDKYSCKLCPFTAKAMLPYKAEYQIRSQIYRIHTPDPTWKSSAYQLRFILL